MNTNLTAAPGSDATQPQTEQNENSTQQVEVEKGSGYGAPNKGSGESITDGDLSPDGQPIPDAGTSQSSDETEQ